MHNVLLFIFRPLRNTHLKRLLVSFSAFSRGIHEQGPVRYWDKKRGGSNVWIKWRVYCFRQNMLRISTISAWTVKTPQCCGGWHYESVKEKGSSEEKVKKKNGSVKSCIFEM